MALITKIEVYPLGEFTINFSIKSESFEIKYPKEVAEKIKRNVWFKSYDDVKKELEIIKQEYLYEVCLLRKVIIIQLKTSESNFNVMKEKFWRKKDEDNMESVIANDYLKDAEGFEIRWYIAEEYSYPREKRYKIIERNKNGEDRHLRGQMENIHRLLWSSNGEYRILDYREDLHLFL